MQRHKTQDRRQKTEDIGTTSGRSSRISSGRWPDAEITHGGSHCLGAPTRLSSLRPSQLVENIETAGVVVVDCFPVYTIEARREREREGGKFTWEKRRNERPNVAFTLLISGLLRRLHATTQHNAHIHISEHTYINANAATLLYKKSLHLETPSSLQYHHHSETTAPRQSHPQASRPEIQLEQVPQSQSQPQPQPQPVYRQRPPGCLLPSVHRCHQIG